MFRWIALALVMWIGGCGEEVVPMTTTGSGTMTDDAAPPDAGPVDAGPTFDPTAVQWERAAEPAAGPLAIWAFLSAAIDEHRTVVFGGTNAGPTGGTVLGSTWLYDTSSGELVATEIATDGPDPRYCGCAGWDPNRERVVLSGGRDLSGPANVPAETWELDLEAGTWTEAAVPSSPPGVIGCAMAWSESQGAMYLFGGASNAGASALTYRYEPEDPVWVELEAAGPSARYDGVLTALDDENLMLFGGSLSAMGAAFFSDLWRFDTTTETWSEIVVEGDTPQGRRVPWLALTPDHSGFYLAMGFDGEMEPIGDFWFFDFSAASWTPLTLPPELNARAFTGRLPAAGDALGTMLGGYRDGRPVREIWRLSPL